MQPSPQTNNFLTPAQQQAVAAPGNVLVMAGAGTGKTHTLVERCLNCLEQERAAIDEILIVTFTEAAAAEMRQRLRKSLEEKIAAQPDDGRWPEQTARFDLAPIGTLHGFCLKLIREHFYELGLDPQLAVLDEGETRQLANETLEEQFQPHYAGDDGFSLAFQDLIQVHGSGRDEDIRKIVLRLHHYAQTRPDAADWRTQQIQKYSAAGPASWQRRLLGAIQDWRDEWLPVLENLGAPGTAPAGSLTRRELDEAAPGAPPASEKAVELAGVLRRLPEKFSREHAAEVLQQIIAADGNWPAKRKTVLRKPLEDLFDETAFLQSLAEVKDGGDPLAEDWSWIRGHMETLLRLAEEFAGRYSERKRADGVLDFHDLEQFALKLLWDFSAGKPTAIAETWRAKLKFIFVDEYQDINAAQDKIIQALSRDEFYSPSPRSSGERAGVRGLEFEKRLLPPHPAAPLLLQGGAGDKTVFAGNRFLVGDVKQSIYRFRLADPKIFREYAKHWRGGNGQTIPLSENFRSRAPLLNFVNSVFRLVMREEIGGVNYDADAELKPGRRADLPIGANRGADDEPDGNSTRPATKPEAELLIRFKAARNENREDEDDELAGLDNTQREARLVAGRLQQLVANGNEIFDGENKRAVEWRDIAILLRSPRGRAEIFAKEFERAAVPLAVARGGFYESVEILDLLGLLQLLDNPLQDVPCIAALRSPLAGLSLDELVEIRLAARGGYFWTALNYWGKAESGKRKADNTLPKVTKFLERFTRWRKLAKQVSLSSCLEEILAETFYTDWLRAQPRGAQRAENVAAFLHLAQQFDQFQRQGLFRFLKFIEAQREAEAEPEVPAVPTENAVRLMSIHQSKGLEFPVVVLSDLAKPFNEQDLHADIIFDEELGPCPKVRPPSGGRRYPSLPHWLARRRQKRELRGEELRLLYVAMTRARDKLILTVSVTEKNWGEKWMQPKLVTTQMIAGAKCFADWLAMWFGTHNPPSTFENKMGGELPDLLWRIVADTELEGDTTRRSRGNEAQNKIGNESEPPHVGCYEEIKKLRERLEWNYPFKAATKRKAKSSVTALRREAEELDDEAEPLVPAKWPAPARKRKAEGGRRELSAAEIGAAHHTFLQHVALDKTGDLATEAERLVRENYLSADERAALDLDALRAFWNSSVGGKILANAAGVRRELPFTVRFSPAKIAKMTGGPDGAGLKNEFVVVQGVADLVVLLPREIWLVDFKTDAVTARELPGKIKNYTPQLKLYAGALGKIHSRPVTHCWLHFLAAGKTVDI